MAYFYHQVTEKEKRTILRGKKTPYAQISIVFFNDRDLLAKGRRGQMCLPQNMIGALFMHFSYFRPMTTMKFWQLLSDIINWNRILKCSQINMLRKCQWYCDLISESYTDGHRRICEVTRLLFIMHKFHIELNHDSKYKMQYIIYTKSAPKRLFFFSLWKAFFHNRHLFMVMPFWCLCGIECETVCVYLKL